MKTKIKLRFLMMVLAGSLAISNIYADPPNDPPPPPGGGHGSGTNQPPSGAPIDGGAWILLVFGTAVGCFKIFRQAADRRHTRV
jgi:hypothetical protein